MARTKQTARKCLIQMVPRKQLVAQKCARKSAPIHKLRQRNQPNLLDSDSDSDQEDPIVNNQQFSLKFDDQAKCQEHAIESQFFSCTNCQAIMTSQSKLLTQAEYKKLQEDPNNPDEKKQRFVKNLKAINSVWICEFCLTHNAIPKSYILPSVENPCFLIEKAKKSKKKKNEQQGDESQKILIFCIDISGSMDLQVLGNKTRLSAVKQAIIDEISRMKFEKEVIKVGLVTFGSIVTLVGDGKTFKQTNLNNEIYNEFDKIIQECSKITKFASPILKSHDSLKVKIQNLSVYGCTALGPGLLASIEIASKGAVGSKVIICTDGQANVGVGTSFGFGPANGFYEKAANFAKNKGVSVNILSLKGDKCNLKELGKLSLASGGSILKIQPSALGTQFSKISKQQVLGTSSQLVIKVNKIFEIISHVPNELSADKTTLTQNFGNFSSQTELAFEFKVLTKQEAGKKAGVQLDLFNQPRIPMQVQLTYVGRNGNKYTQIITDWRELTEDEKAVFDDANFAMFAASVLQRASTKIKTQDFPEAEKVLKGYWSIVNQKFSKTQKAEELTKFGDRVKKLQTVLNSKIKKNNQDGRSKSLVVRKSACKKVAKKIVKKKNELKRPVKGKQADKSRRKERSISSSDGSLNENQDEGMSSDEQEQILWKEMRARSRSRSRSRSNSADEKKRVRSGRK